MENTMSNNAIKTNHAKLIVQNLTHAMALAANASTHDNASVKNISGSLQYFSGCKYPLFNGIFNNSDNHEKLIIDDFKSIKRFFANSATPWVWWWTQQKPIPNDIIKQLDDNNLQSIGECMGMGLDLTNENLPNSTPTNVTICRACNNPDYEKFLLTFFEVFEIPEAIQDDLQHMLKPTNNQGFIHYIALINNKPIAILTAVIQDKTVGLYNAATLPEHRKLGVCSALITYAIMEAKSLGCDYSVAHLQAPAMAKQLVEKLGFKQHCSLLGYLHT